jgi:3-oxoacyl-[acyl-carrier protein] reductase
MQISFRGKKAVIAGGSRGIGRAIALAFAAEGAAVAICARGREDLDSAEAELERKGVTVFALACDLADEAQVTGYVAKAANALGGVDVLVNNASGMGMKDDETGWRSGIDIDLLATARAVRVAVPLMERTGGGSIINISSISGFLAMPRSLPYAAVKAAVINYTMGQALALAAKRIRVNAIAPGSIEFPGGVWDQRRKSEPELYRRTLASIPWQRYGTPEEVAAVAVFLASDLASWVTGQTIVVDGGQSLR